MEFLLCMVNAFLIFSSYPYFVFASSIGSLRRVPIDAGKRRWKIYSGIGGSFDEANVFASSATYNCM